MKNIPPINIGIKGGRNGIHGESTCEKGCVGDYRKVR